MTGGEMTGYPMSHMNPVPEEAMSVGGGGIGGKTPFPLLSEPISPSSLLFEPISPYSQLFLGHFSLLPILFLPPPRALEALQDDSAATAAVFRHLDRQ